jgi:hypothetical protein
VSALDELSYTVLSIFVSALFSGVIEKFRKCYGLFCQPVRNNKSVSASQFNFF